MIKVLSIAEIRACEKLTCEKKNITEKVLIDDAAKCVFEFIAGRYDAADGEVAVFCGGGNNGADGARLCLLLWENGFKVAAISAAKRRNENTERLFREIEIARIPVLAADEVDAKALDRFSLVVDAIFGIGLSKEITGSEKRLIDLLNASGKSIVSIDIPSGIHANTGAVMGVAVKADFTVTFSAYKIGHFAGEGLKHCGKTYCYDIGILTEDFGKQIYVLQDGDIRLPKRERVSHKYDYGKIAVVGGCERMPGAPLHAYESARAALRAGAGLCVLCVPQNTKAAYMARVKEEMLFFTSCDKDGFVFRESDFRSITDKADAVVIGMGAETGEEMKAALEYLIENFKGRLILDAGALGTLALYPQILESKKRVAEIILTPHAGEYKRLLASIGANEEENIIESVRSFAKRFGVVLAYKSAVSIVSDGGTVLIGTTGTPALAKGGSGDVLAGIIAAFSVRLKPLFAAAHGCYTLGILGEKAEKEFGTESVLAGDLVRVDF